MPRGRTVNDRTRLRQVTFTVGVAAAVLNAGLFLHAGTVRVAPGDAGADIVRMAEAMLPGLGTDLHTPAPLPTQAPAVTTTGGS